MTDVERTLLLTALHAEEISPAQRLAIQKMGDRGFDFILARVREEQLGDREKLNALRLLGALGAQFCADRLDEVVDEAVRLSRDPSRRVRSFAVNGVMWSLAMLGGLRGGQEKVSQRLDAVRGAIYDALREGIDPEQDEAARDWFRRRGWDLPNQDGG